MKNVCIFAVCALLFSSCAASTLQATAQTASAPVIGAAIEQNGLRFETWLVSAKIAAPDKSITYEKQKATTLFSVRVTNLTQKPVRLDPFNFRLNLVGPDGKEIGSGLGVAGSIRQPGEKDYLLLESGVSAVVSRPSSLYWYDNKLCLDWPSWYIDHPLNYGELFAGSYQFTIKCSMTTQDVQLYDDHTGKVIKTLNGFWTGDVTTPPQSFHLVKPSA